MIFNVLNDKQRSKIDKNSDLIFYSKPRFVHHLDDGFRTRLTNLYRERISEKAIVLDLMSSWVSHLPKELSYQKVIGHGLNSAELQENKRLDSYWIQDLNNNQTLPLKDSSVDVCLMVAAWQYLQYPEKIAFELRRIIKPGGHLIISFSNRAFWEKAPTIWREGSDLDHIIYIKKVLIAQGWPEPEYIFESGRKLGLFNFMFSSRDPFFSVLATNT